MSVLTIAFLFQLFDELIFEGGDINFAFFEHRLRGCGGGGLTGGSLGHCLVGRVVKTRVFATNFYRYLDYSVTVTKITEFLDFGATFDLDRIFSFFYILKVCARHPPLQNRVFGRCLKNGKVAPKCHI